MKKYQWNQNLSLKLYEKHKNIIECKMCYNNIFNIFSEYPENFYSGEWKIAYGYVSLVENMYCRHCFILVDDMVVDPTLIKLRQSDQNIIYYVFKVFDNITDYVSALENENGLPALCKSLRQEDLNIQNWAKDNGILCIG